MDILQVYIQMSQTSGGGEPFFNIGLLSLLFFALALKNSTVNMVTSRGPTRDGTLNLALKIIPALFITALGALAAMIAQMELFEGYAQYYAMEALFDWQDGMTSMVYTGSNMFLEVLAACLMYGLLLFLHGLVARRAVVELQSMERVRFLWRTVAPDLVLLAFAALFSLAMSVKTLMFRVTLNFDLGNYLYALYFCTVFLMGLRIIMIPLYSLVMVPGCWARTEKEMKGDTAYERFVRRARQGGKRKALLGMLCLLLMIMAVSALFYESWVYSGENVFAEGMAAYRDRVLRFDDASVIYESTGYLQTAQGSPAEDLYFAEVADGIYLAVYVEHGHVRQLEPGGGNTVTGKVQGFRSFPEKKFRQVAEELGIDAEEAVLLPYPVRYMLLRAAYGNYVMGIILLAIPLFLLGLAAVRYFHPLGGLAIRKFIRRNSNWQELLGQLEMELEDQRKIVYQGSGLSAGYYVTRNFLFQDSIGAVRVLGFSEVLCIESVESIRYGGYTVRFQLKNGQKTTWSVKPDLIGPIRSQLAAAGKRSGLLSN